MGLFLVFLTFFQTYHVCSATPQLFDDFFGEDGSGFINDTLEENFYDGNGSNEDELIPTTTISSNRIESESKVNAYV